MTLRVTIGVPVEIETAPAREEGRWRASSRIAETEISVEARGYYAAQALLEMHLAESLGRALTLDAGGGA